jgi:hypothetical protein
LDLRHCLFPSDFEFIYNVLFARRYTNEKPSLRKLINTCAITTKLKRTFKASEDPQDDSNDEILIFWKFDLVELPRIKSELISIYEEKQDIEFKLLNRSKYLYLVGVATVHTLTPPEQYYLLHQIENYIERKKPLGELQVFK